MDEVWVRLDVGRNGGATYYLADEKFYSLEDLAIYLRDKFGGRRIVFAGSPGKGLDVAEHEQLLRISGGLSD